jgi:phage shock protein PspC (stress-responsive transcriptional regulator)
MAWRAAVALNGGVPEQLPVISRPREGAVFAGVCAGLARRMGVQPIVLRVIAVVTAVALGGLGLALYIAGFLLLPREGEQYGPLSKAIPALRRWPKGLLIALVVVASILITWGTGGGPALVPAMVIGLVLWFGVFRPRAQASTRTAEPTPFERAADAWRVRLAEQQVPGFETAVDEPRWEQPYTDPSDRLVSDSQPLLPAVAEPPRSWRLWGLTLALAGIGTGTVALLGLAFGLPASPLAYFGAILAALGITGLVAARYGRPPLLVPAIIVAAALAAAQLVPNTGPVTDYSQVVTEEAQLPGTVKLSAGNVDLDLSRLNLTRDQTVTIEVGAGDVQLNLPDQASSTVNWRVGAGDANLLGQGQEGFNLTDSLRSTPGGATAGPVLTINLKLGAGSLEVKP